MSYLPVHGLSAGAGQTTCAGYAAPLGFTHSAVPEEFGPMDYKSLIPSESGRNGVYGPFDREFSFSEDLFSR